MNLTPRINAMVSQNEKIGLAIYAGYGKHWTGEQGRVTSWDPQFGIRFYRFTAEPGITSAAWTLSPSFTRTVDMNGTSINRINLTFGMYGLL